MASNKKVLVAAVLALALFLVSYCAEAFMCETLNPKFHGPCVNDLNCASSCVHLNLGNGGHCVKKIRSAGADIDWTWRRKLCACVSPCSQPSPPIDDPPSGSGTGGVKPLPPSSIVPGIEASN